jgi:predicted RNA-binding Zn-ribbon protein involved in translation (DUF1610 family)
MQKHLAYCAALDREVHVFVRPVSYDETDGCVADVPGIICLEHAEDCLGIECPLFDVPADSALLRYESFSSPRSEEEIMQSQTAYCSACDQDVHIVVTDAPVHSDQAPLADPEVVCLDFGGRCTGAMCPMFGLPSILMGVRLAKSGLRPQSFTTFPAPCQDCGEKVDMQVINSEYTLCPACGARNRWLRVRVGDDDYIALATVGSGD